MAGSGLTLRHMSNNREKDAPKFAEIFKALSNPNRLKIFLRLIDCCPPESGPFPMAGDVDQAQGCTCVGDLGLDLGIVPSTISHHIKELRRAGLIRVERNGQRVECSFDPETLAALRGFFS